MLSMKWCAANAGVVWYPAWKVKLLAIIAWALGVRIHVHGFPFGANKPRFRDEPRGDALPLR